jgi:hypothetical protein
MHKVKDITGLGYLQFFDSEIPGLQAGDYEITVDLSLPNTDTNNYSQSSSQSFSVQGPQFTIDAQEIHAMFPGDNTNGSYSEVLPFISLQSPALPWERAITKDGTIPWMALLLFTADEMNIDPLTKSPIVTTTVAALLTPEDNILKPKIDGTLLPDTILSSAVNTIVISTDVFEAITPRLNELAMLARQTVVDPSSQPINNDTVFNTFADVMANRFPKSDNPNDDAGAINYAQLISLEGWADYLVDTPEWPVGVDYVQLVSLAGWSFTSTPDPGQSFAALTTHLINSTKADPDTQLLRIPVTGSSAAATRIKDGYTALSYQTMEGTNTFCWYRGPFCPYPAVALPLSSDAYLRPAAAMIYDEASGIFDNSYSAAWSIGRAMALADPALTNTMQLIRSRAQQLNAKLMERSYMPHLAHITDAETLLQPGISRKTFMNKLPEIQAGLEAAFQTPLQDNVTERPMRSSLFPDANIPEGAAAKFLWFMQQPIVQQAITAQLTELIDDASGWLAKTALLEGVPFNHLVPDQRMLPVESARFFYIDQSWINMMLQGALSAGVFTSADQAVHNWLLPLMMQRIKRKVAVRRSSLLKKPVAEDDAILPVAGMLLRSALLTSYPALTMEASDGNGIVDPLRMENIASNIRLVLWKKVPGKIIISQPDQGLSYGVEDEWKIVLRSLDQSNLGASLQKPFPATGDFTQFMRPLANNVGGRVLQLVPSGADNAGYLVPALNSALNPSQPISSSTFSIQMIRTPEQIIFDATFSDQSK